MYREIDICIHESTYIYIHIHVFLYFFIYVYIYIQILIKYLFIYIYIYIYIYMVPPPPIDSAPKKHTHKSSAVTCQSNTSKSSATICQSSTHCTKKNRVVEGGVAYIYIYIYTHMHMSFHPHVKPGTTLSHLPVGFFSERGLAKAKKPKAALPSPSQAVFSSFCCRG